MKPRDALRMLAAQSAGQRTRGEADDLRLTYELADGYLDELLLERAMADRWPTGPASLFLASGRCH